MLTVVDVPAGAAWKGWVPVRRAGEGRAARLPSCGLDHCNTHTCTSQEVLRPHPPTTSRSHVAGLVGADGKKQVTHSGVGAQLPVVLADVGRLQVGPLRQLARVQVLGKGRGRGGRSSSDYEGCRRQETGRHACQTGGAVGIGGLHSAPAMAACCESKPPNCYDTVRTQEEAIESRGRAGAGRPGGRDVAGCMGSTHNSPCPPQPTSTDLNAAGICAGCLFFQVSYYSKRREGAITVTTRGLIGSSDGAHEPALPPPPPPPASSSRP